jgi:purine nucleosidase
MTRKFHSARSLFCMLLSLLLSCSGPERKVRVIFDTDTNNELDDQHALAYLLNNEDVFTVAGVTVNATFSGGGIEQQYNEAKRVVRLCGKLGQFPVLKGADQSYNDIYSQLNEKYYDGKDAVDFIIDQAKNAKEERLLIIAVGKLTNIALALETEPEISKNIKLVWLGSNYPDPGEYNLENDIEAMNFVLSTDVPFEMALVRYGLGNGTDAVRVTLEEIRQKMSETGHTIKTPVTGRDGGIFYNFGDYSISLFEHAELQGTGRSRALFDMAAVAVAKNPAWARTREIPAPVYDQDHWQEIPDNSRKIGIIEDFNRDAIVGDFFQSITEKKD